MSTKSSAKHWQFLAAKSLKKSDFNLKEPSIFMVGKSFECQTVFHVVEFHLSFYSCPRTIFTMPGKYKGSPEL
jgi:hypothetical protein